MRAHLMDALEWACPDTLVPARPNRRIRLDAARGGTLAATILLNGLTPGRTVRIESAPRSAFRFFRLHDVPVEANTGPLGFIEKNGEINPHVFRRAPFRVFDAMEPVAADFPARAAVEAVRVHLPVSADARPGPRAYVLNISSNGAVATVRIDAEIHKTRIPPSGAASWPCTNWFDTHNIAERHGIKPWSEAHWSMLERYARLMARNRQNVFWFTFNDMFAVRNGRLALNRVRLRRYVGLFTRAGLHFIEGGHFGRRLTGEWTCPAFGIALTRRPATSAEGDADIADAARQLMEEIARNRWNGRYLQHVADEPIPENAVDYRIFAGMVRKYMPGIPVLDATLDPSLPGAVDVWCPQAHHYQEHRERFEAMRARGDRIWYYTCCFPGGPWLNRLLDMELIRPALFGWGAALYKLDGFLHWGLNCYRRDQDPFRMSVVPNWAGGDNSLPAGDTHVVYPGPGGPWSSVRFEAQREGLEDLELIRRLRRRSPRRADTLVMSVIRAFDDFTRDPAVLRAARRKLLRALA